MLRWGGGQVTLIPLEELIGSISRFNLYLGTISRLQINNIAKHTAGNIKHN